MQSALLVLIEQFFFNFYFLLYYQSEYQTVSDYACKALVP